MQVYEGIVKDRVVILPEEAQLEEGLRVEVWIREGKQDPLEEVFKKHLVEAGLVETIKRPSSSSGAQDRTPVQAQGRSLSEQIIEERR